MVAVTYLNALFQDSPRETEENNKFP